MYIRKHIHFPHKSINKFIHFCTINQEKDNFRDSLKDLESEQRRLVKEIGRDRDERERYISKFDHLISVCWFKTFYFHREKSHRPAD